MNKSIVSVTNVMRQLVQTKSDYVIYESSYLSHLMKDSLGGNSLSLGIFNLKQGDFKGSSLSLRYLTFSRKIVNYPIVNDSKAFGLLRKMRAEIIIA